MWISDFYIDNDDTGTVPRQALHSERICRECSCRTEFV